MLLSFATVALMLAGCASRPAAETPAPEPTGSTTSAPLPPEPVARMAERTVASTPGNGSDPSAGPQVFVYHAQGNTSANAAMWGLDSSLMAGVRAMDLFVPEHATGLVVEVAWSDPVQDLDAEMHAPEDLADPVRQTQRSQPFTCVVGQSRAPGVYCNPGGRVGAPDAPSRIALDADELAEHLAPCSPSSQPYWGECGVWAIGFRSKDVNAMVQWHVYASVFVGQEIPKGYSAVPSP